MTIIEYLLSDKSEEFIANNLFNNIDIYQGMDTDQKVAIFSGSLYNYFVNECVMNNQYLSLSKNDYAKVKAIYIQLIKNLRNERVGQVEYCNIRAIVKEHRSRLVALLAGKQDMVDVIIPCSEYSTSFQENILRLDISQILEPIIDIGCGHKASLVNEFRKRGLKAYGIDQYLKGEPYLLCENWLEFNYSGTRWGTVIAHMSFTNHLRRCLVYNKAEVGLYIAKYHEIIESLQPGGSFIYCPSLPEIESGIDKEKYAIVHYGNCADALLDTVRITRYKGLSAGIA